MALADIETIVFVMLENRSFDHMLGYLSTQEADPPLKNLEGLSNDPAWIARFANRSEGKTCPPYRLAPDLQRIDDPPHDSRAIAIQIGTPLPADPAHAMGGFVASYQTRNPPPQDPSVVMGHYGPDAVPMFDFLAHNYAVCDHWFAALPSGTQPNRLMAMSGESKIADNAAVFLPDQPLAYDWLTQHKVGWCAYQWGDFFPFFSLMPRWLPEITASIGLSALGGRGRFRRYDRFREDWTGTAALPSVIFVEPEYTDGPHAQPNDDHPPTGIARGQAFLADIYDVLTANPARWQNTMMIVTYDEHGGFFDHVPPLDIGTEAGGHRFASTGVRVPALVMSPHVAAGSVFAAPSDHTSFLQLLADRFNPGQAYSAAVAMRQKQLGRLSTILRRPRRAKATPALPADVLNAIQAASAVQPPSSGVSDAARVADTAAGFHNVALKAMDEHPDAVRGPGWERVAAYVDAARRRPPQ